MWAAFDTADTMEDRIVWLAVGADEWLRLVDRAATSGMLRRVADDWRWNRLESLESK